MGLFDLPAPLFAWMDQLMAGVFPPLARLALWAAAGALVSLELYRLLSPQTRIRANQSEQCRLRRALESYDGELAGARPLIGRLLRAAGAQVALVAPAALAASLPLLCLIAWLSTAYGYRLPPSGDQVPVRVEEPDYQAAWLGATRRSAPRVIVMDAAGRRVIETAVSAAVPSLHKRHWWNSLVGNPAGYLPPGAPVQRVEIELPRMAILTAGPGWIRGWEPAFFATLLAASLLFKFTRRIA